MYKKMSLFVSLLLAVSLLLSSCGRAPGNAENGETLQGNITISGAFALYPLMTRWAEEFQKIHPNVQFDISAGGAGKGMTDALSGAVEIGMVSRSIKPEEEAQGAYAIAVAKDAVFAVVNASNPVAAELSAQGIRPETFVGIYITGDIKTWGQVVGKPEVTQEIHVYTRSDACGAAEMWAKFTGNKKQEDLLGIGVNGDPGVLEAVLKDPLGIGYNNLGYAFDLASGQAVKGAFIVPIDLNGNGKADEDERIESLSEAVEAVASGKYPSPPARLLYLVTKNKPGGVVQAFLHWILTDGQAFVNEAGYVRLTPDQLAESLERVK
ncbi:MAG: substrate-binding domain-containing protein [Anaerolineales bacterium]|nr:substrate-binding domain-containing protein [Anaerolineales bacterium]MDW8278561.1 substrate-binding domain-containing protein [Anaerolineales bacterium]